MSVFAAQGEERAEVASDLARRYALGSTLAELTAIARCSIPTVKKLIVEGGGAIRVTGRKPRKDDPELVTELAALYRKGWSLQDIADHIGRSNGYVSAVFDRNNIRKLPRTGRQPPAAASVNSHFIKLADDLALRLSPTRRCQARRCPEAARYGAFYCGRHQARFSRYSTVERPCQRCGDDIDTMGRSVLCKTCRESHGYCTRDCHKGDRIMPLCEMDGPGRCKACKLHIDRAARPTRESCQRCRKELDLPGASSLCGKCYENWRYCSRPEHKGHRIMPLDLMDAASRCKACANEIRKSVRAASSGRSRTSSGGRPQS